MPQKIHFPEEEWTFHKVPKRELRYCALWELERLCGNKRRAWLKLTEVTKSRFILEEQKGLQEMPVGTSWSLAWLLSREFPGLKVITFLIDLRQSEAILLNSFKWWLRSSQHRRWQTCPSSTTRWRSLLAKIVVARATKAGLERKEAIEITAVLWKSWKLDHATAGILSAPHWSRALHEAEGLNKLAARIRKSLMICDPCRGTLLKIPY